MRSEPQVDHEMGPGQAPHLQGHDDNPVVRFANWMFRNRNTGRITIAQWPNVPLAVFLVAAVVTRFLHPSTLASVIAGIGTAALAVWSADEILRGVNPWRRLLGALVLVALVFSVLTRL